jgi:ABC-2 type transport system permease protein
MILLFTSIFTMISVIEDRHEGFLRSVLVAPIPRSALVLGKTLGGATLALIQGLIFVALAPAVGISLSLAKMVFLAGALLLVALALTGLGFVLAWRLDSVQGFHAVATLVLVPLWLLSGSLFPASGASFWVRWVMKLNPLTYADALVRQVFYLDFPGGWSNGPSLAWALGVTALFAVAANIAAFQAAAVPRDFCCPAIFSFASGGSPPTKRAWSQRWGCLSSFCCPTSTTTTTMAPRLFLAMGGPVGSISPF